MIPPFPDSSLPRTEAACVQPIHASAFSAMEFSGPPTDIPLDLNFSQKGPQNMLRVQNEADGAPLKNPDRCANSEQEELTTEIMRADESIPNGIGVGSVEQIQSKTREGIITPQKPSFHWRLVELTALFDAKKVQAEKAESGPRKLRSSTIGKWEEIADACKASGVSKSALQCREKWEKLWPPFRLILEWESKRSEKKPSYWTRTELERVQGGFPGVFDREVYDAMAARFGFVTSLDPGSPVINSLNVESGGPAVVSFKEPASLGDAGDEVGQNGNSVEDGQAGVDNQQKTSGRKRKAPERLAASKQTPTENNKVTMLLDPKEEIVANVFASPGKELRASKSKSPLDITERRLLLEEKKIKLAEQRFFLEERKLQATIEIGRSLIASMERMTGTISGLGAMPSEQR